MIDAAACPAHPDRPSVAPCNHCGTFLCANCRTEAAGSTLPYCVGCADRRTEHLLELHLPPYPYNRTARASFAIGLIGVVVWCLAPVALVGGLVAVAESRKPHGEGLGWALAAIGTSAVAGLLLGLMILAAFLSGWRVGPARRADRYSIVSPSRLSCSFAI